MVCLKMAMASISIGHNRAYKYSGRDPLASPRYTDEYDGILAHAA